MQRDEVAELIQYTPTTDTVQARPLIVVPPPIGTLLLPRPATGPQLRGVRAEPGTPGVHAQLAQSPGRSSADWGIDTYAGRIVSALDAARGDHRRPTKSIFSGFCAGGILTTTVLNHLGRDRRRAGAHRVATAVTLLDFDVRAPIGAFSAPGAAALSPRDRSRRQGVLAAQDLGAVFSWMRPDDLVFDYLVNNYLMGERPARVRHPGLERRRDEPARARCTPSSSTSSAGNLLAKPDALTVLGSPVDLGRITVPMFITGRSNRPPHPVARLLPHDPARRRRRTFALSNSGHIASLVNPPGNPRASFRIGPAGGSAEAWKAEAPEQTGSWWEGWSAWLEKHSGGEQVPAPQQLGSAAHPPLDAAPGLYVRDLTP